MGKLICKFLYHALVVAALLQTSVVMAENTKTGPVIAIIIDDMGDKLKNGNKALSLPGKITYSFLPYTPHSRTLANQAHSLGKEVMLHLPMETETGKTLGQGGLNLHMTEKKLKATTTKAVDSIPHVKGINNHMGSLLTRHPGAMEWFVQAVKEHGKLYFVDSRTTVHTVARQIAAEKNLPSASRDVFLDHVREKKAIRAKFKRLLAIAKKQGSAIGIGHPYPETLAVLKKELSSLGGRGVRLVPVSRIVEMQLGDDPRQEQLPSSQVVARRLQGKQ
jgi:polysaccharide deacetylase 2 family uncharacterized protein YibQ